MRTKRALRFVVNLFTFSFLFIVLGEALTAAFFSQRLQFVRENKYVVCENIPRFRGREIGREYNVLYSFNEAGMRGRSFPYEKSSGTTRILFLGDSFMASLQVEMKDFFITQLSDRLNQRLGSKIEILPVGVGGWDNVQELIYLKNEGIRYQPDMVVVLLDVSNDINGNYSRWHTENLGQHVYREDLNLNYREAEPVNRLKWLKEALLQRSHFFNLIYFATYSSRFRENLRMLSRKLGMIEIPERNESFNTLALQEKIKKGWEITFKIMDLFKEFCDRKGIQPIFVIIPDNTQVHRDHYRKRFRKIQTEYWGAKTAQPRLIEALTTKGIEHIDLTPYFLKRARETPELLFFRENEHCTIAGHRLMAEVLTEFLAPRIRKVREGPFAMGLEGSSVGDHLASVKINGYAQLMSYPKTSK